MTGLPDSLNNQVGLFFIVRGELLLHSCKLEDAEPYGAFLNYSHSHDKIWREHYQRKYGVDFDFFPRGRIIYNKTKLQFTLYYDGCIEAEAKELQRLFSESTCIISQDEHYQCQKCCDGYVR